MSAASPPVRADELRARLPQMLADLEMLVNVESPSGDRLATAACAAALADLGQSRIGAAPERVDIDGCSHLLWRFGKETRVLLLGHLDTVWPSRTIERWPFAVEDGKATGPGVFDMKAGLVQGLHALSVLESLDGVTVLVTADEELGSPSSRRLIEETARGADAALVLEPSVDGALKTERKGVSTYCVEVIGRAAHAGLEPDKGVNALVEMAHQVLRVIRLADPAADTTVSPTVATAGTTVNVVPAAAAFEVDVRVSTAREQLRIDEAMFALSPESIEASVRVTGGPNRPPLESCASMSLFARAQLLADRLGLPHLVAAAVGGASDGNLTACQGVPTLDGLGAVGAGAHAEGEHIVVAAMPERAALVAALVADLSTTR